MLTGYMKELNLLKSQNGQLVLVLHIEKDCGISLIFHIRTCPLLFKVA